MQNQKKVNISFKKLCDKKGKEVRKIFKKLNKKAFKKLNKNSSYYLFEKSKKSYAQKDTIILKKFFFKL